MASQDGLLAWDGEYKARGGLWAGKTRHMPDLFKGSKVLELGCGNGKTILAMCGRGLRIAAVDFSKQAVMLARDSILSSTHRGEDIDLLAADGCALPFKSASFDAVFAFHVIGHLKEDGRQMIAAEATRVLSPGGRIFFRDFSTQDMRYGTGTVVEGDTFRRGGGTVTHYFKKEEVCGLFADLTLLEIKTNRWTIGPGGGRLLRSEIHAVFQSALGGGAEVLKPGDL